MSHKHLHLLIKHKFLQISPTIIFSWKSPLTSNIYIVIYYMTQSSLNKLISNLIIKIKGNNPVIQIQEKDHISASPTIQLQNQDNPWTPNWILNHTYMKIENNWWQSVTFVDQYPRFELPLIKFNIWIIFSQLWDWFHF